MKKNKNKNKNKNKKNKGFTLIELLAVIVILGLLMAIAIPSVTKYITQSRKKTVTTTIGNYINALVNAVNDLNYTFTSDNTIYAVPIECISLERGGTNPFGEWSPVSNSYWAYVLVQYDDINSSYKYGFTFKDSAGYGLYPTSQGKLKENGKQIVTDLTLSKPKNGLYSNIAEKDNWTGFEIDDNTKIVVLEENGNGLCEMPKPAVVISGMGTEVGDMIQIDTEKFYVIENNASTITMLAATSINPDLNNPIQNSSASGVAFSDTNYWSSGGYSSYVYDENSNLYQYVEAYEQYLQNLGANSANASLISYEQLIALGCKSDICRGENTPNWISNLWYWTGSSSGNNVWRISNAVNSQLWSISYSASPNIKIRPIIIISKSEIDFNQN